MDIPRIGVGLPNFGPQATPDNIISVAKAAERLGFHSVWTFERLLIPILPDGKNPYGLREQTASVYDPLETLTWVAAHTRRVRLGTSVLDALFHPPVVLARRLATLDRLSAGRVVAGIGQGWMPEEFAVVGVPLTRRGAGLEEHLAAMRACWAPNPVEYSGRHYQIPRSEIGPKPVRGHVQILIGGVSQPAIERAARLGDGFAAVFQDWDATRTQIDWYHDAGGVGPVVLRVNPERIDVEEPAAPFTGTVLAVIEDLAHAARIEVSEVIWDLNYSGLEPQGQVDALEALASKLKLKSAVI